MSDGLLMVQADSVGYAGKPCTVLSVYDPESGILKVKKLVSLQQSRVNGCLVVAFDPKRDCDVVMQQSDFSSAVNAFLDAYRTDNGDGRLLRFEKGTERASPANVIEAGEYDESGPKIRVDAGITCEQMAVIATCWAVCNQRAVGDCFAMGHQLIAMQRGIGFSI